MPNSFIQTKKQEITRGAASRRSSVELTNFQKEMEDMLDKAQNGAEVSIQESTTTTSAEKKEAETTVKTYTLNIKEGVKAMTDAESKYNFSSQQE